MVLNSRVFRALFSNISSVQVLVQQLVRIYLKINISFISILLYTVFSVISVLGTRKTRGRWNLRRN